MGKRADCEAAQDGLEWLDGLAAEESAERRSHYALSRHPVGFIAERDGNQYCLVGRGDIPEVSRREDQPRKDLVERLNRPKLLMGPKSVHEAHECAAHIHARSPWMSEASAFLMSEVERRIRSGLRFTGFAPLLLHGGPGVGKTHYARFVAEAFGPPLMVLDGASMVSVFQIAGVERGWGTAATSPIVRFIAETGVANPIVVIDEVDKVGGDSRAGRLHSALLGQLEGSSSKQWRCPFTEMTLDLSRVSWVLTANDLGQVPPPLKGSVPRHRCQAAHPGAGPRLRAVADARRGA